MFHPHPNGCRRRPRRHRSGGRYQALHLRRGPRGAPPPLRGRRRRLRRPPLRPRLPPASPTPNPLRLRRPPRPRRPTPLHLRLRPLLPLPPLLPLRPPRPLPPATTPILPRRPARLLLLLPPPPRPSPPLHARALPRHIPLQDPSAPRRPPRPLPPRLPLRHPRPLHPLLRLPRLPPPRIPPRPGLPRRRQRRPRLPGPVPLLRRGVALAVAADSAAGALRNWGWLQHCRAQGGGRDGGRVWDWEASGGRRRCGQAGGGDGWHVCRDAPEAGEARQGGGEEQSLRARAGKSEPAAEVQVCWIGIKTKASFGHSKCAYALE